MAAVKMKNKLKKDCARKLSLNACHKPNKTNTRSLCQTKSLQRSAMSDSVIQNHNDVSSLGDVSNLYAESDNDTHDTNSGPSTDIFSSLLPFSDSARLALQSDECISITATLFSPNLDHTDWQFKPISKWQTDHYKSLGEQTALPHLLPDDSDDGSCGTTDSRTCPASDFCVSESVDVSCKGELGSSNIADTDDPDYECMVADLMYDVTEFMILPFLENDTPHNEISTNEAFLNSDTSFFFPIHQMKPTDQNSAITFNSFDEGAECFDPQLFLRNLPDLSEAAPSLWPVLLPKETRKTKYVTLVLDLDETLVHSTLECCDDADFTFPVLFNMKQHTVYVKRRPHLQVFLEKVAEMFDVVIFTASQSIYAEQLLDMLDPEKKLISQRMYRESCIFTDGIYTKDLTILGVDLAKVAIIDNSPQVFRFQVNNGIPIKSWFDDPSDCALISLLPFLESLVDADDVRPVIARNFGNKEAHD